MILRNLTARNRTAADVKTIAYAAFRSRSCEIFRTADPEIVEFIGLLGTSSLITGNGRIAVVESEGATKLRVEVELLPSNLALLLTALAFIGAIFTLGITFLLFWILREQACGSVVTELDRAFHEISVEVESLYISDAMQN